MSVLRFFPSLAGLAAVWLGVVGVSAQRNDAFQESRHHPALKYGTTAPSDTIARLNARLEAGEVRLTHAGAPRGYLPSALEALGISPTSQVLVYSQTSFQASHIAQNNPRAIYFNDDVAVAFIRGAPLVEISSQDPVLGTVFYQLSQTETPTPRFNRSETCLSCHLSWDTRAVPGPFVLTTFPRRSDRDYANGGIVDHRESLDRRWGGWFVTGAQVPPRHMGNVPLVFAGATSPDKAPPPPALKTLIGAGLVRDEGEYLTPYSDIVALLVLEHQLHAMNLMTRASWEHRLAERGSAAPAGPLSARTLDAVDELVDYLLFVDEVPLGVVKGTSGFAEWFGAQGPKDATGRSLRTLQLNGRLMRYPLSYTVYSAAFESLPAPVKGAVYQRLWEVLSGKDPRPKFAHLTRADRLAIIEILRATRTGLPDGFASTAAVR